MADVLMLLMMVQEFVIELKLITRDSAVLTI